jgi:hypothetical protein
MRLLLLLSLAAVGCSSANVPKAPPEPVPQTVRVMGSAAPGGTIAMGVTGTPATARSFSILATPAEVWRALPAAYESLGIPISTMDSATGTIGNAGFNVRRRLGSVPLVRYIDCGSTQGGPSAETYDVRLVVTTVMQSAEAATTLATTVEGMGKPVAFSGEYVRCGSSGALEARIADAVKAKLAK